MVQMVQESPTHTEFVCYLQHEENVPQSEAVIGSLAKALVQIPAAFYVLLVGRMGVRVS